MSSWYCSREAVKRAAGIDGGDRDFVVDRLIETASRILDRLTRRYFIPRTETRYYPWPPLQASRSHILWLDQDLISVTTLQTQAQDTSPTIISSSDYFLEPINTGPPYNRIEIDLSSSAAWEAGDTPQRSISVLGSWGYDNETEGGGTVASGLASSAAATSFVCSDGSRINVGNTLLIESEQLFVSERTSAALAAILIDGALTADKSEVSVTVDTGHSLHVGEVILVGSERMYVEVAGTTVLTVIRAYDGSVLAAHANDTAVHVFRTLTVERGVNGTTAATHANATAISVYTPPLEIQTLCIAEAIAAYHQERSGWGREIGSGEGQREWSGRALDDLRKRVQKIYRRARMAVV